MEMYLPGWDPSDEPYANTTIDLSHAAIAQDDPIAMADRLGLAAAAHPPHRRHRLAKDEHLVPGRGTTGAAEFLRHLAAHRLPRRDRAWRSTPARPATREEREDDLRESLEFAREHFFAPTT